ncbi:hypothetical protein ES707_12775 [subsurface metagenome]
MRKAIIIILAMVVALSALPVTFAGYKGGWKNWDRFWQPSTTVVYSCPTDCNVVFTSVSADDNEFTSSWEHKEVAQTTASIQGDCSKNLDITITNAYPGYEGIIDFCIKNMGIYPATVNGINTVKSSPFYAEIDLTGELEGAVIQLGEIKCGQLVIHSVPQLEEAQNKTFTFTITIDFVCFPTKCETAYAYYDGDCDGDDCATCFSEYGFSNWGWTNGPLEPSEDDYTFDIYAGAGSCDPLDGEWIGELTVNYDGSTAYVFYDITGSGYTMDETHLYVGSDPLPSKNGGYTVSPGQYPYKHDLDNKTTDEYTVTGLSGDIYIVAHAVACP